MENLTDVFSKFFSRLKNCSNLSNSRPEDTLLFTKVLNEKLLEDLQKSIKDYAKKHIKNFDPDQDYQELKKIHSKDNLFKDAKFQPKDSSVFYSDEYKDWLKQQDCLSSKGHIIWRRAKEISRNASMAVDKNGCKITQISTNEQVRECFNTADLNQGLVGDW